MDERRISRFGEPPEADLPDDIASVYAKNRERIGFVPNVFRAYARRPEHFRAFMQYHDVLMKGDGGLTRAEREAIVVAVSAENRCQYCVTAHGEKIRSSRSRSRSTGAPRTSRHAGAPCSRSHRT
jgi:uncharacterized peroxidase-related enzyme